MPCYSPKPALFSANEEPNLIWLPSSLRASENAQKKLNLELFIANDHNRYGRRKYMDMPCRQCIGCRLDHAKQWTVRNIVELQQHNEACWLTLTYAPEHKLSDSLRYEDAQKFIRALRKKFRKTHPLIRYYLAAEYGTKYRRPHFHICIYGWEPLLKLPTTKSQAGFQQWTNPTLDKLWPHGMITGGELNAETIGYTARYITKKINGDLADAHYRAPEGSIDLDTGEVLTHLKPEFNRMSLKPGIGGLYYEKNKSRIVFDDAVFANGRLNKTPRYFDKLIKREYPEQFEELRLIRETRALEHQARNPGEKSVCRLTAKQAVQEARAAMLKRSYD
jgi:hypothetical protein